MQASRARYNVVGLAVGLAVLSYMQRVAISQAAGPIAHDLHLDKQQMGLVFGAFGLSYALFELPMGLLGDRLGVRIVLARIVLAWSGFTALTGAAWNVGSLYVVRFLFGAGEAGCFPNLTRMLSMWLPERERVKAQSLMWACTRWGGAATPPLALLVIGLCGWRWAFVGFALLGAVWCAVFLAWFKDDPAQHVGVNAAELELLEGSRRFTEHKGGDRHWLALLLTPQVFALVLQYFCFSFVWYFYVTWLPTYLREARGQTPARAAALSVLPLLFGGFGSLLSGMLPIGLPRRRLALVAFCGAGALLFAFIHLQAVGPAMVCMGLASFCSDMTMPISWNACVGDRRAADGDGGGDDEYAGEPGGVCGAGGGRGDPAADGRELEPADLHDGGGFGGFGGVLALSGPSEVWAGPGRDSDDGATVTIFCVQTAHGRRRWME